MQEKQPEEIKAQLKEMGIDAHTLAKLSQVKTKFGDDAPLKQNIICQAKKKIVNRKKNKTGRKSRRTNRKK